MITNAENHQIRVLETQLLDPIIRGDAAQLAQRLADEFIEFGSSGRIWSKADVLRELPRQKPPRQFTIVDFDVSLLGPNARQSRYLLVVHNDRIEQRSLRSSIWVRTDGRWQMRFHQGTSVAPD